MSQEAKKDTPVTIRDIAEKLHVSSVSVHRALSGKEGVSDELRARILKTSEEMGYQFNYAASSIRKKQMRIAVVLPTDENVYYSYFWDGVHDCYNTMSSLNIVIDSFVCRNEKEQCDELKKIADQGGAYSGVLTFSYSRDQSVLLQLQRLVAQGVATVVIDDSIKEPDGICNIPSHEKKIGEVAAQLVCLMTPEKGAVIVTEGRKDSVLHVNKLQSFVKYLKDHKPGIRPIVISGYYSPKQNQITRDSILKAIHDNPDTVACYALTSHDNSPMAEAVGMAGLNGKIRLIGSDLNVETRQLLENERMDAVINQGAYLKGYTGLKIIADHAVKNLEMPGNITIPIDVIFKSNLSCYDSSGAMTTRR
ncbi:MAG: LacI family DNA-binding transcriptional regulator [Lachnospiraceae bacterium]|jgi:DNA-binding LacI/PurR family transcriptional regulator|nr:LacI family DNA-binding transcriptional regulator [Lachnospiraceae bacterium]MCH4032340.1 LacI family DNA-binding transcriptional regulator [Lachnospiraceae bacterium]MCH4108782.1 LacI family DNA-binding transcriptional regulator [Lachnospiraceae bacterium]MCI1302313.1 LacI family DNA-binding transcriptional regulator [Lachnospiraceae bacterium]MCI1331479.1 LacI family DNA-binding transcriptional regulator [Lachnospiraceae bacterium]